MHKWNAPVHKRQWRDASMTILGTGLTGFGKQAAKLSAIVNRLHAFAARGQLRPCVGRRCKPVGELGLSTFAQGAEVTD